MRFRNIFLFSSIILVLALIVICYPQIYYFKDKVHYKNFYVYYDEKIPQEVFPILDQVEERLKKSRLYDQNINFKIFLRNDVNNYNMLPYQFNNNVAGWVIAFIKNVFLYQANIKDNIAYNPIGHKRPLVSLLSHELTHVLIESKWSLSRIPWLLEDSNRSRMGLLWKEEGYAEYISGGTGYSFEEGMSYLNNNNPPFPFYMEYFKSWLAIRYLIENKGMKIEDILLRKDINLEDVLTEASTAMSINDQYFTLENFDELFTGNPVDIEKNMTALLPEAERREDKSIYLQILSQIALAQAMQQNFDLAHKTLDMADGLLEPRYKLAQIRLLLERGRVYHQSGNTDKSLPLFIKSYEKAKLNKDFDFHTVNAAHMVAIVANDVDDKIKWNKIAIALAEKTSDERCQAWLGAIHNNLAQNYIEAEKYSDALDSFQKCKSYAEERGDPIVIRGASWGIARSLRSLNQLEKALKIQKDLLIQYEDISSKNLLPIELVRTGRGLVYEELAEIYLAQNNKEQSKKYSLLAYDGLSQDPWMKKLYPKRLERMKELSNL